VSGQPFYSTRRAIGLAAIVSSSVVAAGCMSWPKDRWSFDRLRDDRAIDIEQRLDRTEPIVKNPFE
jgi:hypothetical protein